MRITNRTSRFTNRVENYVKYRPSYPTASIRYIVSRGILPSVSVADVGSGTGIMTRLLLPHCKEVFAIEPNDAMRERAESDLVGIRGFRSILGTAESTGLDSDSVGAIVCAQAYHWFNSEMTRKEFGRILRESGKLFLVWNDRLHNTPFLKRYDELLVQYGVDYAAVNHQRLSDEDLESVFDHDYEKAQFPNKQQFVLAGLIGRLESSSYVPSHDDPKHAILLNEIEDSFRRYSSGGTISFNYSTTVYSGTIRKTT